MRIEAVCIDLDGTLLDTIPDLAAAANAMLVDLRIAPLPVAHIREFVGKGAEVLIQRTLEAAEAREAAGACEAAGEREATGARDAAISPPYGSPDYEAARARFYENYRLLNGAQAALYPGVPEGLEGLRALGLKLACVTNKPMEFVPPLLQRFALTHYFDFSIAGDTLPFKKPHPAQLLEACRRWSLDPARVMAVGDSLNDAQAARAAGMPVFLVPYGYNEGRSVYEADVDGIVSSLSELPSLIQGQNARVA